LSEININNSDEKRVKFPKNEKFKYNLDIYMISMDFSKIISKAKGQSLAQLAISGVITVLIVAAVISALLASNTITDATILALVGLVTLIVTVVVIMQILSKM
jgi:hypothetical protein